MLKIDQLGVTILLMVYPLKKDQINYCLVLWKCQVFIDSEENTVLPWFSERKDFFFFFHFWIKFLCQNSNNNNKKCVPLWIKKKITNYIELLLSYFRLNKKKTSTLTAFIEQFQQFSFPALTRSCHVSPDTTATKLISLFSKFKFY